MATEGWKHLVFGNTINPARHDLDVPMGSCGRGRGDAILGRKGGRGEENIAPIGLRRTELF
jgi:hypothetical protein